MVRAISVQWRRTTNHRADSKVISTAHLRRFRVRQSFSALSSTPNQTLLGTLRQLISAEEYQEDLDNAALYLSGRSQSLIESLTEKMDQAAQTLNFEAAARYRDQMGRLRRMQSSQNVDTDYGDVDVIAVAQRPGLACISLLVVRDGRLLGHREFWPGGGLEEAPGQLIEAFAAQYYLGQGANSAPAEILVSEPVEDEAGLSAILSQALAVNVRISHRFRTTRAHWMEMAKNNAMQALAGHVGNRLDMRKRLDSLVEILDLPQAPERMECFDISHTQGEATAELRRF